MLSVGSSVRSAQARISCEPPIQVTVCSTPALRRASIETRESLPPPMATRAWRRRPSCSPFPSGISPSPSRGGPGWGWVSVGLGGNPSPPTPPLDGEGFKAGFVEGDGSEPGNRILPCKTSSLLYATSPRPLSTRSEEDIVAKEGGVSLDSGWSLFY